MAIELIDQDHYQDQMDTVVLPTLQRCQSEGWMEPAVVKGHGHRTSLGGKLHYVCYDSARFDELNVPGAVAQFHGTVVISHGFTEFARKYSELIWYFLIEGYSVCVLEHRGHGLSARDIDDPSLVWIDDWRRYVADMAKFSQTVAKPFADGQPLFIFGHSMGGGIAAALLEQYPSLFDRAVLSCPMIAPATGAMPNWLAGISSRIMCALGLSRSRVPGYAEFAPEINVDDYPRTSEHRIMWFHQQRCEDVRYHTFAPTFAWVREALKLSHWVQRPSMCDRIETPILLFQARYDEWVLNSAENRFAQQVRDSGASIEVVHMNDSPHEILSTRNDILGPFMLRVFDYLDDPAAAIIASGD